MTKNVKELLNNINYFIIEYNQRLPLRGDKMTHEERKKLTAERDRKVLRYYKTHTGAETAAKFGISAGLVGYIAHKYKKKEAEEKC